jgi:multimeric flavodoxin WrbA
MSPPPHPPPQLLIVYHSQSGTTEKLARTVEEGALKVQGVLVKRMPAVHVTFVDVETARVIVICSPEYFGYMAGAVKDFFDRTYDALLGKVTAKPYALVISARDDGSGALNSIERIITGLRMKRVQMPIMCRGGISPRVLTKCAELGETLAAGIELGIY